MVGYRASLRCPFGAISLPPLSRTAAAPSTGLAALAGRRADRYNPGMRHPTRLGLAVAALLVAVVVAYSAFWLIVAGRVEDGVAQWAASLRTQHLDLAWRAIRVGGFPLSFRVVLSEVRLSGLAATAPNREVHVPLLSGSASPWNLRSWQLTAPDGLSATANLAAGTVASLSAPRASGSVAIADEGGATLWFSLSEPVVEAGGHLAAHDLDLWLNLPPHPPQTHTERGSASRLMCGD
jgi:hypothetical protein